jgi:hypothetical protein
MELSALSVERGPGTAAAGGPGRFHAGVQACPGQHVVRLEACGVLARAGGAVAAP